MAIVTGLWALELVSTRGLFHKFTSIVQRHL